MKNTIYLLRLTAGARRLLAFTAGLSLLGALVNVIRPLFFKQILDHLVSVGRLGSGGTRTIIWLLGGLLLLSLFTGLIAFVSDIVARRAFLGIQQTLHLRIFEKLISLPLDFFETNRVGELIQRFTNGIQTLSFFIDNLTNQVLGNLLTITLSLVLVWFVDPWAGLIASCIMPISIYLGARSTRAFRDNRREANQYLEQAMGHLTETMSSVATIRSFGQEGTKFESFRRELSNWVQGRFRIQRRVSGTVFLNQFLNNLAVVLSVGVVALGALHGHHTPGDVLLIALYMQQITGNLFWIMRLTIDIGDVEAGAERVVELLETRATVVDRPGAVALERFESLQFKNVSFSYPEKRSKVLRNISFTVKRGETLALVGPSGVGKSTITKLIMRFYDPSSGAVLINGRDVRDYTQESVRAVMAMVMQDVALFNDTIQANLAFARPEAKVAEVKRAARLAHADEFIREFPEGYETLVGERGIKLSGGQKQRVAIARAILKDPELIILDEATSALDSESERLVKEGMEELMKERTAVVIAHRLSTVMHADKILVLQGGKVVEHGSHAQLIKKKGLYARLFQLQSI